MAHDTTGQKPDLEAVTEKAKPRMANLANKLASVIGPQAAGEIMMGCAIALIAAALGDVPAARYLRTCADGLDGNDPDLAAEIGDSEAGHA